MNLNQIPAKHFTATTPEILQKIESAQVLFIAVAMTAPTITTPPMALGRESLLSNGQTASKYAAEHDCGWNTVARLRAMSIEGIAEIDRDMCTPAQLRELDSAIAEKPVFIDEAALYLGHLAAAGHALPKQIFDLSLVTRIVYPDLHMHLHELAAEGLVEAVDFVKSRRKPKLRETCIALGIIMPGEKFPKDREWSPGVLGAMHKDALSERAMCTRAAFLTVTGSKWDPANALCAIMQDEATEEFLNYQRAQIVLARMHANGMPVSTEKAQEIELESYQAMSGIVQDLIDIVPALEPLKSQLNSSSEHASGDVRKALGAYAASVGRGLPCGVDGLPLIGSSEIGLAGHHGTPGLIAWAALETCKRNMNNALTMRSRSKKSLSPRHTRVHPITAITAVTGRTTCKFPNAQGLDMNTKAIIQAWPDNVLIEADFGAIEIRIAAAWCVNAMNIACKKLTVEPTTWVHQALQFGAGLVDIPRPTKESEAFQRMAYWFQKTLRSGMPLVKLLQEGNCPHNFIAAQAAIRAGDLALPDDMSLMDYMRVVGKSTMKAMVSEHRDAAKLLNLGLIYLRTAAGLHKQGLIDGIAWTREDAEEARDAWFDQFPEVAFWGELTLALSVSDEPQEMMVPKRYENGTITRNMHWHSSQTLGGRFVVSIDNRIINAKAQGTGADILMLTLAKITPDMQENLVMVVHDSLVFEVNELQAEQFVMEVEKIMNDAALYYLAPYGIPSDVEVKVGKNWAEMR